VVTLEWNRGIVKQRLSPQTLFSRSLTTTGALEMNRDVELLRRLLRAKDHMDRTPHQSWPIARLASVSGTSEAHFARSFRQAFGTPPHATCSPEGSSARQLSCEIRTWP
jgi:AraC-like DNA-binding protein